MNHKKCRQNIVRDVIDLTRHNSKYVTCEIRNKNLTYVCTYFFGGNFAFDVRAEFFGVTLVSYVCKYKQTVFGKFFSTYVILFSFLFFDKFQWVTQKIWEKLRTSTSVSHIFLFFVYEFCFNKLAKQI